MKTCIRSTWLAAFLVCAGTTPALAQGPFVGVSLTGDIVRFSRSESDGVRDPSASGEAIGFALRVGAPLGSSWGVDAEFARPATIENEGAPGVVPLPYQSFVLGAATGVERVTASDVGLVIYPPISYNIRASQRNTTFSAGLWARQAISSRAALVYSGGVGFHRTTRDVEFSYGRERLISVAPFILPRTLRSETIRYSTQPYAGIELRVGMTERLELVPAVRLHALEEGVLMRPAVGLSWTF